MNNLKEDLMLWFVIFLLSLSLITLGIALGHGYQNSQKTPNPYLDPAIVACDHIHKYEFLARHGPCEIVYDWETHTPQEVDRAIRNIIIIP